jgi:triphosphoribosyl-dephospho-CoA synthetase
MPIAGIDIWRAANLLVKRHGEDAAIEAAQRADEMLKRGDIEGQSVWVRIVAAIHELQRAYRKPDEAVN